MVHVAGASSSSAHPMEIEEFVPPPTASIPRPRLIHANMDVRKVYEEIMKRKFEPTRYVDRGMIQELGFEANLAYVLAGQARHTNRLYEIDCHADGQPFFGEWPTYKELVAEFMASLDICVVPNDVVPSDQTWIQGRVSFRLFNNNYNITLKQFNAIFNWNHSRHDHRRPDARTDYDKIFAELVTVPAGKTVSYHNAAVADFEHPFVRVLHRMLSLTFFGRSDLALSKFQESDLFFLYALLKRQECNWGAFWLQRVMAVKRSTRKAPIHFGGLVTGLALYLGLNFQSMTPISTRSKVNVQHLHRSNLILLRDGLAYAHCHVNQAYQESSLPDDVFNIEGKQHFRWPIIAIESSEEEGGGDEQEGEAAEEEEAFTPLRARVAPRKRPRMHPGASSSSQPPPPSPQQEQPAADPYSMQGMYTMLQDIQQTQHQHMTLYTGIHETTGRLLDNQRAMFENERLILANQEQMHNRLQRIETQQEPFFDHYWSRDYFGGYPQPPPRTHYDPSFQGEYPSWDPTAPHYPPPPPQD